MRIGKRTLDILKNFSALNPSIVIRPGSKISTMSMTRKIVAEATVEETFDSQLCVYELSKFLGVMTMLKDPELEVGEKSVRILSEGREIEYFFAAPETITQAPEKGINIPEPDLTVKVTWESLSEITKAAGVLGLTDVILETKDGRVVLRAVDPKNKSSHSYDIDLGETSVNGVTLHMKTSTLKMIAADYEIDVVSKKIARFRGPDIVYYVVSEI